MVSRRKDRRARTVTLMLLSVLVLGAMISLVPGKGVGDQKNMFAQISDWWTEYDVEEMFASARQESTNLIGIVTSDGTLNGSEQTYVAPVDPDANPAGHAAQMKVLEIDQRFQEANALLQAGDPIGAITPLHRLVELAPEMPEVYINIGYAFLMLEQYEKAYDYFAGSIELSEWHANAWYGLAASYEGLGELELAMGAMRTYLHLVQPEDPAHKFANRGKSALWEWESQLGRGPWGPEKGIPSGMTAEDVRRDGKITTLRPMRDEQTMEEKLEEYRLESMLDPTTDQSDSN